MKTIEWQTAISSLGSLLGNISFRNGDQTEIHPDQGFSIWLEEVHTLQQAQKTIYLIGNGASASIASHLAADLAKNAKVHTQVFSDLSLITAISNDLGYDWVFAEPLRRRAKPGDMLIAISSSGNSPSVLNAAKIGTELGMKVVTLSAMAGNNTLRGLGFLNIYIAADTYGNAETCHAAILHHWMDLIQLNESKINGSLNG